MMKSKVFLVRHAEPEGHHLRRFHGHFDPPLIEEGIRQSRALKKRFQSEEVDLVFTSPLIRAKHTAELAFGDRKIPIIEDRSLIERNFGVLDGKPLEEVKRIHPNAEDIYEGRTRAKVPGVESLTNVQRRAIRKLKELLDSNPGKNIVIVSHVMWTKSLLCKFLGLPISKMDDMGRVATASISVLEVQLYKNGRIRKIKVETVGDRSHLVTK